MIFSDIFLILHHFPRAVRYPVVPVRPVVLPVGVTPREIQQRGNLGDPPKAQLVCCDVAGLGLSLFFCIKKYKNIYYISQTFPVQV